MKLADTFGSPDSRVTKAVVFVDLNDSTLMKEKEPEASWLTTYGWFFDLVERIVHEQGGAVTKYLGDGVLTAFGEDDAASAINAAIKIQEQFGDENENMRVKCTCSIGIAYGEVVRFEIAEDSAVYDYIGRTVDKAFRLCSAANAKAIFVDTDTVAAAAMNKVKSRVGQVTQPKRKAAEYQGNAETIEAKGFTAPLRYHEIWWSTDRYGISPQYVTGVIERKEVAPPPPPPPLPHEAPAEWLHGAVTRWGQYGFIKSDSGEEFFINPNGLFASAFEVKVGDRTIFQPMAAAVEGKARRAINVLVVGQKIEGRVLNVHPKGYAFVEILGQRGQPGKLFVPPGQTVTLTPGVHVKCTIGENPHGATGEKLELLQSPPAA